MHPELEIVLFLFLLITAAVALWVRNLITAVIVLSVFSFFSALLYVAIPRWDRVVYWLLGHLAPRPGAELLLVAAVLLVAFLIAFVRARDLDAVAARVLDGVESPTIDEVYHLEDGRIVDS